MLFISDHMDDEHFLQCSGMFGDSSHAGLFVYNYEGVPKNNRNSAAIGGAYVVRISPARRA